MNDLNIPSDILDAANLVNQWMCANGITKLGPLQMREDVMQYVDLIEVTNEGRDRVWSNHCGVWLYPGEAVAVVNVRELRKLSE